MDLDTTMILCGSQSYIKMTENPMFHDKSKHIEIQYFYIRDMVEKGSINIQYVSTDEQVANVFTKPLSRLKFEYFHDKLLVVQKYKQKKQFSFMTNMSIQPLWLTHFI